MSLDPSNKAPRPRGIQGEKWTTEEERKLSSLWLTFRSRSSNTYAREIWQPISDRMSGRKPDACHQKAYRMGLLEDKGPSVVVQREDPVMTEEVLEDAPNDLQQNGKADVQVAVAGKRQETERVAAADLLVDEVIEEVVQGPNAWRHDRRSKEGKAWRKKRHEAKKVWQLGLHRSALENFCPRCCEGCEEDKRYRL